MYASLAGVTGDRGPCGRHGRPLQARLRARMGWLEQSRFMPQGFRMTTRALGAAFRAMRAKGAREGKAVNMSAWVPILVGGRRGATIVASPRETNRDATCDGAFHVDVSYAYVSASAHIQGSFVLRSCFAALQSAGFPRPWRRARPPFWPFPMGSRGQPGRHFASAPSFGQFSGFTSGGAGFQRQPPSPGRCQGLACPRGGRAHGPRTVRRASVHARMAFAMGSEAVAPLFGWDFAWCGERVDQRVATQSVVASRSAAALLFETAPYILSVLSTWVSR